jgi:NADPH-dependent 2,4-dienoyl-CoA reductase/sulfur reductase-like enzyme
MKDPGIVIVGSGMAGYALAREFRKLNKTTPVTMVTADDGAVYSKPMLSNALAQGKDPEALVQKDAAQAAADLGIEVRTRTRVTAIDRSAKRLGFLGGGGMAYGKLVLALGASPRPYPLGGSRLWRNPCKPDAMAAGPPAAGTGWAGAAWRPGRGRRAIPAGPHGEVHRTGRTRLARGTG